MINIPVNTNAVIVQAGSSITGSFAGALVLGGGVSGSGSFTGLKDANGNSLGAFGIPNGTSLPLYITSASLAAGSSPVLFYN